MKKQKTTTLNEAINKHIGEEGTERRDRVEEFLKIDKAIKKAANSHMIQFNLESFKRSHTRLYKTIVASMTEYAKEKVKEARTEFQESCYHASAKGIVGSGFSKCDYCGKDVPDIKPE